MGHDLNGLSEIVSPALLVDHSLVDTAGGHRVGLGGLDVCETLVVTEVKVGLHAIDSNIALTMLIGVEGTRVDVDIRVKLLDSNVVASCLKKLSYRR